MVFAVLRALLEEVSRRADDLITESHYHDIGKLCFAFTAFWGYLTFAQFLVIWYGNMAEETHFFTLRLTHAWKRMDGRGGRRWCSRCRSSACWA